MAPAKQVFGENAGQVTPHESYQRFQVLGEMPRKSVAGARHVPPMLLFTWPSRNCERECR